MARLLRSAARKFLCPKYVITDLGGEFTGRAFQRAVARLGIHPRFASADSIRATARLERFWRTMKEGAGLYRLSLPLTRDDLEEQLTPMLAHYLLFRPHEGLGGATHAESFFGLPPAHERAVRPPRGRPGEDAMVPFRIVHAAVGHRTLPILLAA